MISFYENFIQIRKYVYFSLHISLENFLKSLDKRSLKTVKILTHEVWRNLFRFYILLMGKKNFFTKFFSKNKKVRNFNEFYSILKNKIINKIIYNYLSYYMNSFSINKTYR